MRQGDPPPPPVREVQEGGSRREEGSAVYSNAVLGVGVVRACPWVCTPVMLPWWGGLVGGAHLL